MKTKNLVTSGIFTAVICIFSCLTIPVGTVPVTLSLFAVVLVSVVLGAKNAFMSSLAYIFLGLAGLPVFSGFQSGVMHLLGPTGGYIWSYLFISLIIGYSSDKSCPCIFFSSFFSLIVSYILGTLQFSIVQSVSFVSALYICVIPFVLFDIIKIALAIILGTNIKKRMKSLK